MNWALSEGGRLAAGLPTPQPPTPGGQGERSLRSAGISLSWSVGDWRVRPRMGLHASGVASCAPRAARTTGSAATTMGWPHIVVRPRRFDFLSFCQSCLLKVDQRLASSCPASNRRSPPAVVRAARGPTRGRRMASKPDTSPPTATPPRQSKLLPSANVSPPCPSGVGGWGVGQPAAGATNQTISPEPAPATPASPPAAGPACPRCSAGTGRGGGVRRRWGRRSRG